MFTPVSCTNITLVQKVQCNSAYPFVSYNIVVYKIMWVSYNKLHKVITSIFNLNRYVRKNMSLKCMANIDLRKAYDLWSSPFCELLPPFHNFFPNLYFHTSRFICLISFFSIDPQLIYPHLLQISATHFKFIFIFLNLIHSLITTNGGKKNSLFFKKSQKLNGANEMKHREYKGPYTIIDTSGANCYYFDLTESPKSASNVLKERIDSIFRWL